MKLFLLLIISTCLLAPALGAKILSSLLMPSASHSILLERLMRELSKQGHEITYITATVPSPPIPNMTVIHIPNMYQSLMERMFGKSDKPMNMLALRNQSPWTMLAMWGSGAMSSALTDIVMEDSSVKEFMKSDQKFDLVFGEIMMNEAFLAGFSHKYNAPIVALAPFVPNIFANYLVGNPSPSSFLPEPFLAHSSHMTFWQRLSNFVFSCVAELVHGTFLLSSHDKLMRKYFGNDAPHISEILKNTSLVLVNFHHSLGFPRPYVPNMIEVGGMHINNPKPLPKDLKEYMDKSENGVILFSLGSNVKSADMPPELIRGILSAFARLKQNVLWKFEAELSDVPPNVKVMKWLPQSDILDHPNLKLFITHGGLLSTTEAVARGVPVIGIPIFGDQHLNMKLTEESGSGKTLSYDDITEESLYAMITEIINDPKYKEVAMYRSSIFKDNPIPPLDTAVWWIEYVLRHNGAHHLRSAAQDLTWYQYYLLDVYLLGLVVFGIYIYISLKIGKCTLRFICRKLGKCSKTDNVKKNK